MKTMAIVFCFILFNSCSHEKVKNQLVNTEQVEPNIVFTVTNGIIHPESALYSKENQAIFVSNVASGNPTETKRVGYISKLSTDGKIIKSKWVTGLKAPKGMAIVNNELFVSDVNQIVKINIKSAKIIKKFNVKNAKFLNDVVADAAGNIYVSDMFDDTIYILNQKGLNIWIKSTALRSPNGLYTDRKEHILLAQWGSDVDMKTYLAKKPGSLATISLKDENKKIVEEESFSGHLDGIDSDAQGNIWVSDWISGDIYKVQKNGKVEKVFNFGQGTADISIAKDLGLLLVPQMGQNKVIAIKI